MTGPALPPTHTPYDGSSKLFAIGLRPLAAAGWIEIDDTYDAQLREKRRLYAAHEHLVFVAESGTEDAQAEVLALLRAHLAEHFPERFRQTCKGIAVAGHPALTVEAMNALPPLKAASLLVQEDLILMRRGPDGWRLAAGSLCFPSSWVLTEKFGRPLNAIHEPVPGFGPGSRPAELIERMFDRLQDQAVERYNWSIQADDALYHPLSNVARIDRATSRPTRFPDGDVAAHAFMRVERQTLRKLPVCGDILFTIRIHLDPLRVLAHHPDRAHIAASFAAQLGELDAAQLDYKGITADRDRLVVLLHAMARGDVTPPET
ncbi:MAG: DUF3445 domain-containing protein [Rhizobiaceae bacterium]|nr:DUF3445 domain-containing protein [Rhizobiaceae bacterium]